MTDRKPKIVPLDSQDEKLLQAMVDSSYYSPAHKRKAQAVLGVARGERLCKLAPAIGYSVASITRACRRYQSEGIAGLVTERLWIGEPRPDQERQNNDRA